VSPHVISDGAKKGVERNELDPQRRDMVESVGVGATAGAGLIGVKAVAGL
jgi:hypothetical protein